MEGPDKIDEYVRLALSKFVHHNGYSEVNFDRMQAIIRKHFITDYNREVQALSAHLQKEQAENVNINRDWYQNEAGKIRAKFLRKVEEMCYMGD